MNGSDYSNSYQFNYSSQHAGSNENALGVVSSNQGDGSIGTAPYIVDPFSKNISNSNSPNLATNSMLKENIQRDHISTPNFEHNASLHSDISDTNSVRNNTGQFMPMQSLTGDTDTSKIVDPTAFRNLNLKPGYNVLPNQLVGADINLLQNNSEFVIDGGQSIVYDTSHPNLPNRVPVNAQIGSPASQPYVQNPNQNYLYNSSITQPIHRPHQVLQSSFVRESETFNHGAVLERPPSNSEPRQALPLGTPSNTNQIPASRPQYIPAAPQNVNRLMASQNVAIQRQQVPGVAQRLPPASLHGPSHFSNRDTVATSPGVAQRLPPASLHGPSHFSDRDTVATSQVTSGYPQRYATDSGQSNYISSSQIPHSAFPGSYQSVHPPPDTRYISNNQRPAITTPVYPPVHAAQNSPGLRPSNSPGIQHFPSSNPAIPFQNSNQVFPPSPIETSSPAAVLPPVAYSIKGDPKEQYRAQQSFSQLAGPSLSNIAPQTPPVSGSSSHGQLYRYPNADASAVPSKQAINRSVNQAPIAYETKGLSPHQELSSSVQRVQHDNQTVNLLQNKHVLPSTPVEAMLPDLHEDYRQLNCDPDILRCTLTYIPQTDQLLKKSKLPLGIIIHPFKDLRNLPVIQSPVIVRCRSCRTYINPFVTFTDQRHWRCNICFRVNDLPDEFLYEPISKTYGEPQRRSEVKNSTIEFIAPSEYMLRPPQPAVYLFVLDVSFSAIQTGYLNSVCHTLLEKLENLPGDSRTKIGIITFNSSVHFYNLGEGLNKPQMMVVPDVDDIFIPSADSLLVNLKESIDMVSDLLTTLPERFNGQYDSQSALGPALSVAFSLIKATGGRITVFQCSLPSNGCGQLKVREQTANGEASGANITPATDFYKRLALDCSGHQIAVDVFVLSSQYCDLASLACMAKYSGGCIHYYNDFNARSNPGLVEKFESDLARYLTRKIGFESVMRIRCTHGLAIHTFHGNLFHRSTDLLSLPNINPDAGFTAQLVIEEALTDYQVVSIQVALLYTSHMGERRIRVHTLCLPVVSTPSEVIKGADSQAVIGLLACMAVDRSYQSSLRDARESLVNALMDSLAVYAKTIPSGMSTGCLLAPSNLKLFPMYLLALLKSAAFNLDRSIKLDERVNALEMIKSRPLLSTILAVHPNLYRVDNLTDVETMDYNNEQVPAPSLLQLSSEYVNLDGIYIMDTGSSLYIYICKDADTNLLSDLFNVPHFNYITDGETAINEYDNDNSRLLNSYINWLLDTRPFGACLLVVKQGGRIRNLFLRHLIEDKTESSVSYYEFLQHILSNIAKR